MSKITARNTDLFAGGRDISGHSNSATLGFSAEAPEVTGFKATTRERLPDAIQDVELSFDGFMDMSASKTDELFASLLGASAYWGVYPQSAAASKIGREFAGIMTKYDVKEAVADAATVSGTVTGSVLFRRVKSLGYAQLTAAQTGSGSVASVDFGGTGSMMDIFYRLIELTGSPGTAASFSASMQDSADNTTFVTIVDFGTDTFAGVARAYSAASGARYRRLKYVLAGTCPFSLKVQVSSGSN